MYFVDITDIAENDILATVDYIANVLKAPIAANNLLDELEKVEHILAETPYIYPKVPDDYLAEIGLRFVMVKNFILFYTVNGEKQKVYGIRFLYGRRDWKNILREEK
ncbi:MAG: type II toxin-antitoxin system RelE/ParE family toxin [Spirochaetaceae bacterium]|jgi:plasmid stabilization system protein ParE|nr:type II toxin-antitoxin system RelE/ParE family toxin [Spirochaetaceae bacterium]